MSRKRRDPQRIIVNIDLSVKEGDGPKDDDIGHVVSYEVVVKKVEAIIAEGHINLVETLCEKIAASCLRTSA
jgi:7,8-dihydroneopterin aldolase/epimerase/oxygenase